MNTIDFTEKANLIKTIKELNEEYSHLFLVREITKDDNFYLCHDFQVKHKRGINNGDLITDLHTNALTLSNNHKHVFITIHDNKHGIMAACFELLIHKIKNEPVIEITDYAVNELFRNQIYSGWFSPCGETFFKMLIDRIVRAACIDNNAKFFFATVPKARHLKKRVSCYIGMKKMNPFKARTILKSLKPRKIPKCNVYYGRMYK